MNKKYIASAVCGVLFVLLTVLVKTVDVAAIGPSGTSIGLSALNGAVHNLFAYNGFFYVLTKLIGYFALLFGACMAGVGIYQVYKRRSILKMDQEFLALACLYIAMVLLYVLFEIVIINYRPVIMPDEAAVEASFPSSHTMLVTIIMGSAITLVNRYVTNRKTARVLKPVFAAIIVIMAVGRLLSGVHWFTDIMAGLLISGALVFLYSGFVDSINS